MFSKLSDSLDKTFRDLRGVGKISEKNISDALREVRLALLDADVEYLVAKTFIDHVKDQAMGADVLKSIKPGEQIVKIFHDELAELLGGDQVPLNLEGTARILLCGLNGAGKTTTTGKLAMRLKREGRKPVLVACDLYRPAAIDQLATVGGQVGVPVYTPDASESDVVKVAREALAWAETQDADVILFDTAGRQEIDDKLVRELKRLHDFVGPQETLLIADAATGQNAVSVAKHFDEAVGITGIILTKLDGDARGGAALSMRAVTGKPIKYAGEGEKLDQLFEFHPDRMADRILGMGDVVGMVEQVASKIDEKDAMKSMERMASGQFDFNDFLDQMKMISKLGDMKGLMSLMPGFNKIQKQLPDAAFDPKRMKRTEAIVLSMTPDERRRPEIIKASRRRRIAAGSGNPILEVNRLIKQFGEMRKMMRSPKKMKKMMGGLGGLGGGGGGMPDLSALMGGGGKGLPGGGEMPDLGELGDLDQLLKGLGGKPGKRR